MAICTARAGDRGRVTRRREDFAKVRDLQADLPRRMARVQGFDLATGVCSTPPEGVTMTNDSER